MARQFRLPGPARGSVRLRLTALYGAMFLVSGAILLAIAGGLVYARSSQVAVSAGPVFPQPRSEVSRLQAQNQQLRQALANSTDTAQSSFHNDLIVAAAVALGIMTLAALAMGWVTAGRALRPVRQMTAAARQISAHNLNERLAVAGPTDELKELGDTIDGLLARLEAAFNAQRRFVANASHELRTPLTTMRASLDVAVAKPEGAPPQTIALAARLRTELDRIDALLEAFLVLARAQHQHLPGYAVVPLEYLVGAALADHADAISARNLTVHNDAAPGGAWVEGSQALLARLTGNLVDNAVCHNEPGGWIHITAEPQAQWARLIVENGGELLDPRLVAELTEPFRRLEADRVGTDKGAGLGLSIVAAIAEAHGGRLSLEARPAGGLRVCVELPAAALAGSAGATERAGIPA